MKGAELLLLGATALAAKHRLPVPAALASPAGAAFPSAVIALAVLGLYAQVRWVRGRGFNLD